MASSFARFCDHCRWSPTVLLLLTLVATSVTAPPQQKDLVSSVDTSSRADDDPYRLPRSVLPLQYTLRLVPHLETALFHGRVQIQVEAQEETRIITLHAEGIEFGEISVTRQEGGASDANMYEDIDKKPLYEMVDIILNDDLVPNEKYIIDIDYDGTLRDNMYGFYISSYTDSSGEIKKLAATQFQATHARKAFPCFDEPSFKARFQVSVFAPPGYHALGNMPVEKEEDVTANDLAGTEYFFLNTMTMSPYLLAFVVSDFIPQDDGVENEVTFKTWTRENALDGAEYSLQVSRRMLTVLEEYTNIPYKDESLEFPLDKVDQVALPDFAAGAMENWGLITYRETALLYNDGSADAKKRVATVIAHELLHMWFGNLITTYWWDTTWLNEGFARYFQYYVTDKVETSWRMWDQFLVDQHQMVFALDSLVAARALTQNVSTPTQVSASFGTITYSKGGSILRMISYIIGQENFQKALQQYLKEHAYGNVQPKHLFEALTPYASAGNLEEEQFEELLISWTEQRGFPVVYVERDYTANEATVSQERFLFKGKSTEKYYVPLTWTSEGGSFEPLPPELYLSPENSLHLSNMPDHASWVIFNLQETGYYRVNYDNRNWELISNYLKNLDKSIVEIHLLNRAQLLDDAFNLARAGHVEYEVVFNLADYLTRETDYVPWSAALTAFSYLDRMLAHQSKYPVFKRYVLRLIDKAYERLQWRVPDEHPEQLHLNRLVTWACALDHSKCSQTAASTLQDYVDNNVQVPADLRSVVYCHGIRFSEDKYWSAMWEKYKSSQDDVERGLIAAGLGCSSDELRLRELLQHSIDEHVRKQDASSVFSAVYTNHLGVEVALQFLDDNFATILDYYGSMGSINNIITGIAGRLTTTAQKQKLEDFLSIHEVEDSTAEAAIETVEDNLGWLQDYQEVIFNILDNKELQQYRLPEWVSPQNYIIEFDPDLTHGTFKGDMYIILNSHAPTDTIILHSQGIEVTSLYVGNYLVAESDFYDHHSYDDTHEFLKIYLNRAIRSNNMYLIYMTFTGTLRNNMYGFYLSKYTNAAGGESLLAATQFQPTHARKAFPCFDEPHFKAYFTITVKAPPRYQTIGNAAPLWTRVWDDFSMEVTFYPTPLMSTYLVAFVVSDFEYLEDRGSTNDVEFRTWARSNALSWANYSMQISKPILQTLEDYTAIKYTDDTLTYSLDKVDQVALPDFSAGAMENWGLVTYRETMLLYNDGTASARKSIATVIAHELAHMWFGNLVTTHWWDTTWLNEGFAQYLMFFITDKVKPDWRLMDQFVFDHHQGIMTSDALTSAAALTSPAYTPSQVSGRFSSITYSKGAAFLRMVSAVLGEDNFQEALQLYLHTHRYSTTKPDDLFEEFAKKAKAADLDSRYLIGLLRSWTEQPGFPVIQVERFYTYGTVLVTQKRFLLKTPAVADTTLYFVPLTWVVQGGNFSNTRTQRYLTDVQQEGTIESVPDPKKWIILNVQSTGFYRVNYDDTNWRLLSDFLRDHTNALDEIHVLNRAQLLDDALNLARADQLPYETVFHLTDYLRRETDYVPWASALSGFAYLQRMLIYDEEDRYEHFQTYVLHLIDEQYNRFLFQDRDQHVQKLLLNRVSAWACSLEHPHCVAAASEALQLFLDNGIIVPADLRSVVYCYGIRHSDTKYWSLMLDKYKNSLDNAERALLMVGLACTHEEDRLTELLQHSISDTFIRRQDASSVFTSVYSNTEGVEVALDYLDEHFDAVEEYYGSMGSINNIVVGIAGRLTTQQQRNKMETFVTKHSSKIGSAGLSALETIDENLEWLQKHGDTIFELFKDRDLITFPPPDTTTVQPPTEAPEPPTEAPEPPTEAPEPPTEAPEPPTEAPEPPTEAPEPPTEAPEPPTEAPEPPTEAPEATEAPEPTEAPEMTTLGAGSLRATALAMSLLLIAVRLL